MHAARRLLLAVLLLLGPLAARAATPEQIEIFVRFYTYIAGEPLDAAETATIRAAQADLFATDAAQQTTMAEKLRATPQPPPPDVAPMIRGMSLGVLQLDAEKTPGGPAARIVAVLKPHHDRTKDAQIPFPSMTVAAVAPPPQTPPPARPPAPAPTPAAASAPTTAQLDYMVAIAGFMAGGPLLPSEMQAVRKAVRDGANNPSFRALTIDLPPSDVDALYKLPPAEQAELRDTLIHGRNGMQAAVLLGTADGGGEPDFKALCTAVIDAYVRITAMRPLPEDMLADQVRWVEFIVGGPLLPAEAAALRAEIAATYPAVPAFWIAQLSKLRLYVTWLPTQPAATRTAWTASLMADIRSQLAKAAATPPSPEHLATIRAWQAAYTRYHPPRPLTSHP